MKKKFFNQMLSKLDSTPEVEVLTDPETRVLKGGGCTCRRGGFTNNCGTYSTSDDDTSAISAQLQLPK